MPVCWNIHQLEYADSTQDIIKSSIEDLGEGYVVHAFSQGNGRGRHGRQWQSGSGNLTFSFVLEPEGGERYYGLLSLLCGVALIRAAGEVIGDAQDLILKWPNDVLLGGRKLAGILIEREGDKFIIGIGVNIESAPDGIGSSIRPHANVKAKEFLKVLLDHIDSLYTLWLSGQYKEIVETWKLYAHPCGASLSVKIGEKIERGSFHDLDEFGNLLLSQGENRLKTISSGDVYIGL